MLRKVIVATVGVLFLTAVFASAVPSAQAAVDAVSVAGTINTLSLASKKINIKKANGTSVTLNVPAATVIQRNGKSASLANLALGDKVSGQFIKSNLSAIKLTATGPALATIRGKVLSANKATGVVKVKTKQGVKSFKASAATKISRNNKIATLGNLTLKDNVAVHTLSNGGSASDFEDDGPEEAEVAGAISAINGNDVTITPSNGTPDVTVHFVDGVTMIDINDQPAAFADLKVGMQAESEYDPTTNNAFDIEADTSEEDNGEVSGTVASVDLGLGTLTITPTGGGSDITLKVTADTDIQVNDADATLADVQPGMPVKAHFDTSTMIASEVEAGSGHDGDSGDGNTDAEGTVTGVGASSVTIDTEHGPLTLNVDGSTQIEVNDAPGVLTDIQVNDKIEAEYDTSTLLASKLEVGSGDNEGGGGSGGGGEDSPHK